MRDDRVSITSNSDKRYLMSHDIDLKIGDKLVPKSSYRNIVISVEPDEPVTAKVELLVGDLDIPSTLVRKD